MGWFNYIGLGILIIMMIPNTAYAIKKKEEFINHYDNKVVIQLEQITRFLVFGLMVFNIPYLYLNFWFTNALIVYIVINSILLFIYILFFILMFNTHHKSKAYILSITPCLVFIFSGVMLMYIPLIVVSIIFAICHITISLKNTNY